MMPKRPPAAAGVASGLFTGRARLSARVVLRITRRSTGGRGLVFRQSRRVFLALRKAVVAGSGMGAA